jgi:acid phosphatase family membrane protein YuiD
MDCIKDALAEMGIIIKTIVVNKIFITTFIAWAFAQTLKVLLHFVSHKKIDFRLFVGTGGMPSSHTAFVSALATNIGLYCGWDSPIYLVTLAFTVIVITDAVGVRRAAGKQASLLNKMMDEMYEKNENFPDRLKELLGHTPIEAAAGILLGILSAIVMY